MKKFIMILFMTIAVLSVSAQNNYSGSSKFTDNWSVGLSVAEQLNIPDARFPVGVEFALNLDKQITPIFGATFELGTGINNRAGWYRGTDHICNGTMFDQITTMGELRADLTQAIYGERRKANLELVGGLGWGHGYYAGASGTNVGLAKTGINVNIPVNDAWDVRVQPSMMWWISNHNAFCSNCSVAQLSIGAVYHFKTSNGTHHIQRAELYDWEETNRYRDEIMALKNAPVKERVIEKEKIVNKESIVFKPKTSVVMFAFNSYVLTDEAKKVLDEITGTVNIVGFASPEGGVKHNENLSYARAKAVENYLVNKGVKVLKCIGMGAPHRHSNRVVVITCVE